jgi:hypothetical protein
MLSLTLFSFFVKKKQVLSIIVLGPSSLRRELEGLIGNTNKTVIIIEFPWTWVEFQREQLAPAKLLWKWHQMQINGKGTSTTFLRWCFEKLFPLDLINNVDPAHLEAVCGNTTSLVAAKRDVKDHAHTASNHESGGSMGVTHMGGASIDNTLVASKSAQNLPMYGDYMLVGAGPGMEFGEEFYRSLLQTVSSELDAKCQMVAFLGALLVAEDPIVLLCEVDCHLVCSPS